ncbi:MAG: endolytic transglycosylase MltG [Pseudomonadota bacterium]
MLLLSLVVAATATVWLWNDYRRFVRSPLETGKLPLHYTLEQGATLRTVAADLEARGVVRTARYLRLLGRERGDAQRIKAGEYLIQRGATPQTLLDLFVSGRVLEYSLTLVEGWTFRRVMAAVRGNEILRSTLPAEAGDKEIMAAIGHPSQHPEGRFFPDTYRFPRATTDVEFLRRAYERMNLILEKEWTQRSVDLPLESADEALILASIIEKETGLASERAHVAGVFTRRLQQGMRLQTDPTVIYGMGESFDGDLRRRDLRKDTPYNTYTRAGLPPTPIAIPGREAIHAALHPADGDALYFVASGDGGHQFSATLREHNRAVRRYQLKK